MILLAILIYVVLNRTPKWFLKEKYNALEARFSWKIPFTKLTGLLMNIFIAFLLMFGITISTKDRYIENKNAIYGLKFNSILKTFGFENGMRITSINDNEIDKVDDIFRIIIMERGDSKIITEKDGIRKEIVIPEKDKLTIIVNSANASIEPIWADEHGNHKIKVTIKSHNFSDVLNNFGTLWKHAQRLIIPNPSEYSTIAGFSGITEIVNLESFLLILSVNLIILVQINLLPLPGLSVGNFVISIIEILRKKNYNSKKKRIIGIIAIVSVFVLLGIRFL